MSRWKMNRIGFVNFWLYDEEEFQFENGRLLLRGQNGSGKSITTQSFIPFILDGDRTPSRLDPFGSSDRRMEYYFLGEEGKEESTGYLFLELKKEEEETYRTIGIGQRARRGKPMDFWGFLILDGRRIGYDLWLYRETGIRDILLFSVVAFIFLVILYFYTYKGGVKTIIWTDVLQTTFMLLAVFLSIYFICREMNWGLSDMVAAVAGGENSNIPGTKFSSLFDWQWSSGTNAVKQFIAGIFMTVAMTGLDQGMIQKSLACKDIKSAQKNMYSTSVITVCANYFFLLLGALLCMYLQQLGGMAAIGAEKTDEIFPTIASQYLGIGVGIFFLIGLISASYPSAGNALTSLTTSYCIDFARFSTRTDMDDSQKTRFKNKIHALFAVIFFVIMVILYIVSSDAVVNLVYKLASYTYGPLLGMFFFGIFTKYKVKDKASPYIAVAAPVLCFIINSLCKALFNFELGFTLLIVNGVLTFLGLYLFRNGKMVENTNN